MTFSLMTFCAYNYGDDVRQVADSAFLVHDLGAEILRSGEIVLMIRYVSTCSVIGVDPGSR